MVGLTSLGVYNLFKTRTENYKFDFVTDFFHEFSFTEMKHEFAEKIPHISTFIDKVSKETACPHLVRTNQKLASEKAQTEGNYMILLGYARSSFRDFKNYLSIVVGFD